MDITISVADGVPIYKQIINQIKYLAASGALAPGEELPPIRTLALQLKVTPNTIVRAYDELEAFVSEVHQSRLADAERQRIIEQRIDALLAEAHQLSFTPDDVLRVIRERRAIMKQRSTALTEKERWQTR
jgi:GntR family transcriptional regulator